MVDYFFSNSLSKTELYKFLDGFNDVDKLSPDGFSILHEAVMKNNELAISIMLQKSCDINIPCAKLGRTPLHYAILLEDLTVARKLLSYQYNINYNSQDKNGDTPAHLAGQALRLDALKLLDEECVMTGKFSDFTIRNADGHDVFDMVAISGFSKDEIQDCQEELAVLRFFKLLKSPYGTEFKGLTPYIHKLPLNKINNSVDEFGRTLLHWATMCNRPKVVKMLIKMGAKVDCRMSDGTDRSVSDWTPLHYASINSFVEIIDILVEGGADVNAKTNDGDTSAHLVSYQCKKEALETLKRNGIDFSIKNDRGKTARDSVGKSIYNANVRKCDECREIIENYKKKLIYLFYLITKYPNGGRRWYY